MQNSVQLRKLLAALVLGAAWWFILFKAFEFSSYVTIPTTQALLTLGISSAEQIHTLNRVIGSFVWSAALGFVFGLPFGLIVQKRVLFYWLIFVGTALLVSLVLMKEMVFGSRGFIVTWSLPETWVYFFGVLCFAHLASRISAKREQANVAP